MKNQTNKKTKCTIIYFFLYGYRETPPLMNYYKEDEFIDTKIVFFANAWNVVIQEFSFFLNFVVTFFLLFFL